MGFKVSSFFCGAGGFDIGFMQEGFNVVQAWDFDKYAVESYRANLGEHVQQRDVSEMTGEEILPSDVWLFGFPCQDVSIGGRREGLRASRSGMFFEIMRLLGEVKEKPKFILAENVLGLNKFLPTVSEEYEKAGYKLIYKVYHSKYHGLPQTRERYFLLGVRNDLDINIELPVENEDVHIPTIADILENEVADKLIINRPWYKFTGLNGDINILGTFEKKAFREDGTFNRATHTRSHILGTDKRCGTVCATDYKQPKHVYIEEKDHVRKLSCREYARLQGFPEDYVQVVSNTQFYKQMGNAVSVPVAKFVAAHLKEKLNEMS